MRFRNANGVNNNNGNQNARAIAIAANRAPSPGPSSSPPSASAQARPNPTTRAPVNFCDIMTVFEKAVAEVRLGQVQSLLQCHVGQLISYNPVGPWIFF